MQKHLKLSVPSWIVYTDPDLGILEAVNEFDPAELDKADLEFMGAKIHGYPAFDHRNDAINWVADSLNSKRKQGG